MNIHLRPSKKQAGVVLVVSLIMLLLLTLIGVSGMQSTGLEEKMAGNKRNRNLAFQAAEAALRHAENYIENGLANSNATQINVAQGVVNIPVASAIAGLSAQPTYTITLLAVDYYATNPAKHATFQVIATANGADTATVVRLQTIYIAQVPDISI
ncbi:MAG: PilX N-terminal domain-containing pilus assembly protein [Methylococcaceae bacterium]|nr:PilX N-terminal domain-containing pilus assembly protein [Methylococcaceae bacterium]